MNTGLHGKVAMITGASRGIGKAIAFGLANEGARLVLCARNEEQLVKIEEEIKDLFHTEVISVKANMTKFNDIKRVVAKAIQKFKSINILVNNAGGAHIGGLFDMTDSDIEYHIHLKLIGYIRAAKSVIPYMQQQGGGRIINIIGTAGKEPNFTMMLPGITNGALLNFTKSLASELAKFKITVNSVNPGTTLTPLTDETLGKIAALNTETSEETYNKLALSNPLGRLANPEDIASTVVFLASEAASFISGISINVDGGMIRGSA